MDIDIFEKLNDWTLFTYKKLFGLFSWRPKYTEFEKSSRLTFWVPVAKVVAVTA